MAGLYFEEFTVGRTFDHAWTRTVTEMDNVLFSSLTMNVQPLHLDEEFASKTDIPNPGSKAVLYGLGGDTVAILHNPNPKHRSPMALWIRFDGMKKAGIGASYRMTARERASIRFFGKVANAFDQSYFEAGFRTPGIYATGGLQFGF